MGYRFSISGFTVLLLVLMAAGFQGGSLQRLSSDVTTRIWQDGTSIQSVSSIFYLADGTLIMRSTEPEEVIMKTNRLGELFVYHPAENTVDYQQNRDLSSESSQFFLFFQGLTDDMGLRNMGFRLSESYFEDGHDISYWSPPRELATHISKAKLVHNDYRPVYLSIHQNDDRVLRRTYFHSYTQIIDHDFPLRITTIQYESEQDSIVMQTIFDNIKVNEQANSRYFDFQIPDDARISD